MLQIGDVFRPVRLGIASVGFKGAGITLQVVVHLSPASPAIQLSIST